MSWGTDVAAMMVPEMTSRRGLFYNYIIVIVGEWEDKYYVVMCKTRKGQWAHLNWGPDAGTAMMMRLIDWLIDEVLAFIMSFDGMTTYDDDLDLKL